MVPGILDDGDREFFYRTRNVPERQETQQAVVEAMKPVIQGIKEGGYVYGSKIHYADLVLASILDGR